MTLCHIFCISLDPHPHIIAATLQKVSTTASCNKHINKRQRKAQAMFTLQQAMKGLDGQCHAPATPYPLHRRLRGPQGQSGQVLKILPPPGFDPRTIQPVASHYTDYAILDHNKHINTLHNVCHGNLNVVQHDHVTAK